MSLAFAETHRGQKPIIILPTLNFDLSPQEQQWGDNIYAKVAAAREECTSRGAKFDARAAITAAVAENQHLLQTPIDIMGEGTLRGGVSDQGRHVAAVRLTLTEYHAHLFTKSFQKVLHIEGGSAQAVSIENGVFLAENAELGKVYDNDPGKPHAFVLKTANGKLVEIPDDGVAIYFLAWTARDLKDDTYETTSAHQEAYRGKIGKAPPTIHYRPAA